MLDVINSLEQNLIVKTEIADRLHASFDKLQLSIFNNTKNSRRRVRVLERAVRAVQLAPPLTYYLLIYSDSRSCI